MCTLAAQADEPLGELQFDVTDPLGRPLPCRIHLFDGAGKPRLAPGQPAWRDHFVCSGKAGLRLPAGAYRYEIERGPEHQRVKGTVELKPGRDHTVRLQLDRLADLAAQGWYAGDLHIHRPVQDIELLMQAEDMHIAPVITWWNTRNAWMGMDLPRERLRQFAGPRFADVMAGEDERGGGALLYFHLTEPLAISKAAREFPSPLRFVDEARKRNKNVWIDIEKPFWWDVPAWLASGQMDSIGIANNHMCRSQMLANEAWGRPRDERQFPAPLGNGQWTQTIYYHMLNCGLRMPPSAGSASGVLPNPVGYNRVYVHVGPKLDYEAWWAGLKAGRSFVTNGPLLLCTANGQLPGHVFRAEAGQPLHLELEIALTTLDPVRRIEIIQNGTVVQTLELAEGLRHRRTARLTFKDSGWFLVRAVADNAQTFRFAASAPFHVEAGAKPRRISKRSAQFFLNWTNERIERLRQAPMSEPERKELLETHAQAKWFWEDLVARATAE
jgi:hypothetical protein